MGEVRRAELIATVAHTAMGQKRADGWTRYILHPARVVQLSSEFIMLGPPEFWAYGKVARAAAWLHDVVEDTKLTLQDLRDLCISERVCEIVDLLTKPADAKADPAVMKRYYERIGANYLAAIVKVADRTANLEDALIEARAGRNIERWLRYVQDTNYVVNMAQAIPVQIGSRVAFAQASLYSACMERLRG